MHINDRVIAAAETIMMQIIIAIIALISVGGIIFHGLFINGPLGPGPFYVIDQSANTWTAGFCFWLACNCLLMNVWPTRCSGLVVHIFFFFLTMLCCLCMVLGAGASFYWPQMCWSFLSLILSITCFILLIKKRSSEYGHYGVLSRLLREEDERLFPVSVEKERKNKKMLAEDTTLVAVLAIVWKIFSFLVLLTLMAVTFGTVLTGYLYIRFPATGKTLSVHFTDSAGDKHTYHINYVCQNNETTASSRTFLLESDGSHGLRDFWPAQQALIKAGAKSVCIYDKPGLGFSSYRISGPDGLDDMLYYDSLVTQLLSDGLSAPLTFVGWGGGGELIYEFARRPEARGKVDSLVFLATTSPNVEFRFARQQQKMTDAEAQQYRLRQLNGRMSMFSLIRGVGVPFGLMPIFMDGPYELESKLAAYRAPYLVAKTWCTQYVFARQILETAQNTTIDDRGVFELSPGEAANLPVLAIVPNYTEPCRLDHQTRTECDEAEARVQFNYKDAVSTAKVTGGKLDVYPCNTEDCTLSFPLSDPETIVKAFKKHGLL